LNDPRPNETQTGEARLTPRKCKQIHDFFSGGRMVRQLDDGRSGSTCGGQLCGSPNLLARGRCGRPADILRAIRKVRPPLDDCREPFRIAAEREPESQKDLPCQFERGNTLVWQLAGHGPYNLMQLDRHNQKSGAIEQKLSRDPRPTQAAEVFAAGNAGAQREPGEAAEFGPESRRIDWPIGNGLDDVDNPAKAHTDYAQDADVVSVQSFGQGDRAALPIRYECDPAVVQCAADNP
jgi:hypothetical protein